MSASADRSAGLNFSPFFTTPDLPVYDTVEWSRRDALIRGTDGSDVFAQRGVEFPTSWSQTAVNIVASKYFRGGMESPARESSLRQMVSRVVDRLVGWGAADGTFASEADRQTFGAELTYLLLHQYASFNTPVWLNIGAEGREEAASACYILSVEDSMPGILEWYRQEGMIFSRGAGSGANVSTLRAAGEPLSKGGTSSGPLSFMRAADASAFSIKSGGASRRAARMVVMNADHPDILDFIDAKMLEERKARALAAAGFDDALDGEIYATVAHQNCNMSARLTDAFMRAVEADERWETRYVTSGQVAWSMPAREIFHRIAAAAHACGDPGVQYDTTINAWHTVPSSGRINSSNPCSEFLHLDNTSCNLSSLNLLKFYNAATNSFDTAAFGHACRVMLTAMEIMVSHSSYPTEAITRNSHDFRPLGLGYANLGALLMVMGLPYDSDAGREVAASITALMTGEAYAQSARMAAVLGPFAGYALNREAMLAVITQHRLAVDRLAYSDAWIMHASTVWQEAERLGLQYGYRNAQVSLLAPTGTISIMMDCTTTGIEPAIGLVSHKKLVGGGTITHVNPLVEQALQRLGYRHEIPDMLAYLNLYGLLDGCPHLKPEHLTVFDCALSPTTDGRCIPPEGHVRMVAAVQPLLTGGVSKSVNVPQHTTVQEIVALYLLGWKLGCKSLAVYRDGSKQTQVLSTQPQDTLTVHLTSVTARLEPYRRRLPDERQALTHKFAVGGHEGYLTVGLYDDGTPGEVFLKMAKEGSTVSGLLDGFATAVSLALQYGVPLENLCEKFQHSRFEPAGFTAHQEIHQASSILDYVFHWLALKFLGAPAMTSTPPVSLMLHSDLMAVAAVTSNGRGVFHLEAPMCACCGTLMQRSGTCYVCSECGASSGCG